MNYHFLKSSLFILVGLLLFSTILYSQRPNILLDKDFNFIDIHPFSKRDFLLETRSPQKVLKTYDGNWRLNDTLGQNWVDTEWVNSSKYTYIYEEILGIDISDMTSIPNHYNLSNPYPNPFNPTTTIEFSIPRSDKVSIKVYDVVGKEITTLLTDYLSIGHHSIKWDGNNNSSGIYFIRMESGGFVDMKKVFLLK